MAKANNKRLAKFRPWPSAIILVILAAGGFYSYVKLEHVRVPLINANDSSVTYSPPASSDNDENNARKGSSSPSSTLDSGSTAPTQTPSFTVQIISSTVADKNVHVGTMVAGVTEGTCSLTATHPGQSTLQLGTSTVKLDVNSYDCGVFNMPTSTFPSSGQWDLTLTVTKSDGSSSSASAIVNI